MRRAVMAGLAPKKRSQQEIERADNLLLRRHEAYLEAWLKQDQRLSTQSEKKLAGNKPRRRVRVV
jgi:hypothetical protein